ncbi:MAG TPA: phosphotransferase [Chloroflexota bacterium]|nr:phosphotransferase [Chloroflexota bacterium]
MSLEEAIDLMRLRLREDELGLSGPAVSGASVVPVWRADTAAVLKFTPLLGSTSRDRSMREARFYSELGPIVPIRVPEVLDLRVEPDWVGLVLKAYHPLQSVDRWPYRLLEDAFRGLGRLQAMFWEDSRELESWDWLGRWTWTADAEATQGAATAWRDVLERPEVTNSVDKRQASHFLGRLFESVPLLLDRIEILPETLGHGDFHAGNLLRDDGGDVVWIDWQEVRRARGPEDVAQFFTRSTADGAQFHDQTLLDWYVEEVVEVHGRSIDDQALRIGAASAELLTVTLSWPHYLGRAGPEKVQVLLSRARTLSRNLDLS